MTEFSITRLGHQGDGFTQDGVIAPLTLPGEVVTGKLADQKLSDVRIVTPSEVRVAAPCSHFKSCGGCQMQHASDEFVADWKLNIVRHALNAHGLETDFRPIMTSPVQSRRRASFAARRTKKGAMAGFHARGSDVIIEIPNCQLLDPQLMQGLHVAADLAQIGGSRKGALSVTVTLSGGGLDVSVSNGKPLDGPLQMTLAQFCESKGLARLSWEGEVVAERQAPTQMFGKVAVIPPPGAFLQATEHGEKALLGSVVDCVGGAERVADLFAGCGTFSLPLAQNAAVHAVEAVGDMIDALEKAWRFATGLKPLTVEARDLYRRPLLPDELNKFDAVVLDPPRAGAERQVACLAQSDVPTICYVSCHPASFARDAAQLVAAGYQLNWVQVVDQFRWSSHVELAASFTKPA